jgi:hypothetical protein
VTRLQIATLASKHFAGADQAAADEVGGCATGQLGLASRDQVWWLSIACVADCGNVRLLTGTGLAGTPDIDMVVAQGRQTVALVDLDALGPEPELTCCTLRQTVQRKFTHRESCEECIHLDPARGSLDLPTVPSATRAERF